MRIRNVIYLFFTLLFTKIGFASDPVEFLTRSDIRVVYKEGKARVFPGGHDEKYFATDSYGNSYKLRVRDPLPIYSEIGASLLSQAIGLPTLPVYPILVKRGEDGLPLVEEARKLGDPQYFGKAGNKGGGWFPASLQPIGANYKTAATHQGFSNSQRSEWFGQIVLNYLIDNRDVFSHQANIGMSGDRIVSPDMTQGFNFYGQPGGELANYLKEIPPEVLKSDLSGVLADLNTTISRLEQLSASDIREIFEPYFNGVNSFRRFKKQPEIDFETLMIQRIKGLRGEFIRYFETHHSNLPRQSLVHFKTPVEVSKPHIQIPKARIKPNEIPSARLSGEELLWSYFFTDFLGHRAAAETHWGKELNFAPDLVIGKIKDALTQHRRGDYFVSSSLDLAPESQLDQFDIAQTHLSAKNSKTLVVVPLNDGEAIEIARIAKVAGAQVLELDAPHGSKLDEPKFHEISKTAKKLSVDRIVIVELPGEPLELEDKISKLGYEFIIADHHDYAGLKRRKPYSSLEQVAQILGFDLGSSTKLIEVNDRAFIYGLRDLGASKNIVKSFYPQKMPSDLLANFPMLKSKTYGKIVFVPERYSNMSIGNIAAGLATHYYPDPVTVFVMGDDLRFSGEPSLRDLLTKIFKPIESRVGAHYSGGDPLRSEFWGLKGIPAADFEEHANRIFDLVESVLDGPEKESLSKIRFDILSSHSCRGLKNSLDNALKKP